MARTSADWAGGVVELDLTCKASLLWPIKQIAAKQHFISICPRQSPAAINFLQALWRKGREGLAGNGGRSGGGAASGAVPKCLSPKTTALLYHKHGEL